MYEVSDLEVQMEFCSRITDRDGASDEQLRWGVSVVALLETAGCVYITDTIHRDTRFSISYILLKRLIDRFIPLFSSFKLLLKFYD